MVCLLKFDQIEEGITYPYLLHIASEYDSVDVLCAVGVIAHYICDSPVRITEYSSRLYTGMDGSSCL